MKRSLFTAEWKDIIHNKKLLIPLIAILFIPVLYSGMFLWAFWDPYDRLEDLPVAIVNQDKGAQFEGESLHLGDELVKKLKENNTFNFQFVEKNRGYQDLKKQKYYMLVEIPENFSKNATTLLDEQPKKLEMEYVPNEAYNFLSAQIGETAIKEIKAAISKEVTATYAETMFDKVKELASGLDKASDGAEKLHSGAVKLDEGSQTLTKSLEILASKSIEFNNGIDKVQNGSRKLATGADDLSGGLHQLAEGQKKLTSGTANAKAGADELAAGARQTQAGVSKADESMAAIVSGTEQIQDGASSLASKLGEFKTGAGQVAEGASNVHAGIQQLKAQLGSIAQLPLPDQVKQQLTKQLNDAISQLETGSGKVAGGTQSLAASAAELQQGAGSLSEKVGTLNQSQKQLKTGLGQLTGGSDRLVAGAEQLAAGQSDLMSGMNTFQEKLGDAIAGADKLAGGASELAGGVNQLSDGSNKMTEGSRQLADGSQTLADGTGQLNSGTKELQEKLGDAAEKAGSVHADDNTYDMMGEPVKVDSNAVNHVPNYGTGFAPYFLSLGLFVGALLLSIVFPMREPAARPGSGFSWFIGKFGVIAVVSLVQSLLADAIMLLGLNIQVESVPLFMLTTFITSLTFGTLIQFFVTVFGDPGRFAAILILILQLTTSAGTFPLELIPQPLQAFNAFLPMTYSVQAYKAVISSGDFGYMNYNLGILAGFMGVCILLTIGYFIYKYRRQYSAAGVTAENAKQ